MEDRYDVVVIGGAFSGAATALLLRRWVPAARVLVVERRESFDWKVGEATVEMSGMFLHRVLKLYDHLSREQLPKHGLRYWFHGDPGDTLADMSEVGPFAVSQLPAFQLDRALLDGTLLCQAVGAGAELMQPARVDEVELGWPESRLTIAEDGGTTREVRCRWVVDASGRHTLLSRKLGLLRRTEEHPTGAAWGRWRGVPDLDGPEIAGADPSRPALPPLGAARRLATNHFCGYGYWIWAIPLAGGETSIGVVYDRRYFRWPVDGRPVDQYRAFLEATPGVRELIAGAELDRPDFRGYAYLPYHSERYVDRGWALVGDAGAFLDPYYSPGLDYCSFSAYSTARLIEDDLGGRLDAPQLQQRVEQVDGRFRRSYPRWLHALYVDKYELMGDAELTAASFLFDTGMYYLGVVGPAVRDVEEYRNPIFGIEKRRALWAYRIMRFFRRRMVRLARFRRLTGRYGRRNRGWKLYPRSVGLGWKAVRMVMTAVRIWLRAELSYLGHRMRHGRVDLSRPVAAGPDRVEPGAGAPATSDTPPRRTPETGVPSPR